MAKDRLKVVGLGGSLALQSTRLAALRVASEGAAEGCARSLQLEGLCGVYCEDCDIAIPVPGNSTQLPVWGPRALDREFAPELWNSERKNLRVYAWQTDQWCESAAMVPTLHHIGY